MPTIFERIIAREIPGEIVYEDDKIIAIHDIAPKAPTHILIIPKKVIPSLQEMNASDYPILGDIVRVAQKVAKDQGIDQSGYRLLVNNGPNAGQTIFHLHFHLLGGAPLGEMG